MWNVGLDEAQARIKIAGRNINNLRYADDTTLMAGSEEELKSLLMKVKEESEKLAYNYIHAHMDTLSLTKEARIFNGLKTISLTSGAGKSGQPLVKEWN